MRRASVWIVAALAVSAAIVLVRACGGPEGDAGPALPGAPGETRPDPSSAPRSAATAPDRAKAPAPEPGARQGDAPPTAPSPSTEPRPGSAEAPAPAAPPSLPPSVPAPRDGATLLPDLDLRAAAVLGRPGRGLGREEGCEPAIVEIPLTGRAPRDLAFRVTVVPEGACVLPKGGVVRVLAGRDVGVLRTAPTVEGDATLTLTYLDAAGQPTSTQLHVTLRGTSLDSAADPSLRIVQGPAKEAGPGNVLAGDVGLRGLAGAAAGTLLVQRSKFRDFATRPSVIEISLDDPAGVVAGPLPTTLEIPAGEGRSPGFPVTFLDREGTATLRVRCGNSEASVPLVSVRGAWGAPDSVTLPAGATATLRFEARPPARTLSAPVVTSSAPQIAEAAPPARPPGEYADAVTVTLRGRAAGEAEVAVAAEFRGRAAVRVAVVAEEVVPGNDGVTLRALPSGSKGTIVLLAPASARWERIADGAWPRPVRSVEGIGSPRLTVTIERTSGDPDSVVVPVRAVGADRPLLVVEDALHTPRRIRYTIGEP